MITGKIGGGDWVESKMTCGSILKPLPTIADGNLPTFVVMIPQESGIRAGGSINENSPRRPRHLYKKFPLKRAEAAHSREVIIQANALQRNSMEGNLWKSLRG